MSFPWSQLSAYQRLYNVSHCGFAAGRLSAQHPWLVFEPSQAGPLSSSLNSPPPYLEMETGAIAVVSATDMWGAWK